MNNISFSEYLEYIKIEFSKIEPSALTQEEQDYYAVVKNDLENSKNMPSRILESSVLSDEINLSDETIKNIEFIKGEIGLQSQINRFKALFTKSFSIRSKRYIVVYNFMAIVISLILINFLSATYPIDMTISVPNFAWNVVKSNSNPDIIVTVEPTISPLIGVGGVEEGSNDSEKYVMEVTWEKSVISITYIVWGGILLSIIVFIFNSFSKKQG